MQRISRKAVDIFRFFNTNRMADTLTQHTSTASDILTHSGKETKREGEHDDASNQAKKLKTEEPRRSNEGLPYKKKKVALMMVYCGKNYMGMQRNPGCKTIESELLTALVKAGVVTQDHAEDPGGKMKFQRAARTDKGVSAAGQICSLKIDVDNPIEKINSNLPEDIRVINIKRTTQGFDCKNSASARTYTYMIPTFAFTPFSEFVVETYKVTEDILKKVNETLSLFKGTHNFHNFTSGKKPTDKSATRYIMEFSIGEPFEMQGFEFAVITVKGQSFMLHQIRKMIGITIAIVKGLTNADTIEKCWGPEKVDVPKAPGLGLMLDKLHYDYYNKRYGNDGSHEALKWDSFKEEIDKFKADYIFKTMIETEKDEKSCHFVYKTGCGVLSENLLEIELKGLKCGPDKTLHLHKLDNYTDGASRTTALGEAQRMVNANRLEKSPPDNVEQLDDNKMSKDAELIASEDKSDCKEDGSEDKSKSSCTS